MASCDDSGATLRTVGDSILTLTGSWKCIFVKSSSEICANLFESALYKREREYVGCSWRALGFNQ